MYFTYLTERGLAFAYIISSVLTSKGLQFYIGENNGIYMSPLLCGLISNFYHLGFYGIGFTGLSLFSFLSPSPSLLPSVLPL